MFLLNSFLIKNGAINGPAIQQRIREIQALGSRKLETTYKGLPIHYTDGIRPIDTRKITFDYIATLSAPTIVPSRLAISPVSPDSELNTIAGLEWSGGLKDSERENLTVDLEPTVIPKYALLNDTGQIFKLTAGSRGCRIHSLVKVEQSGDGMADKISLAGKPNFDDYRPATEVERFDVEEAQGLSALYWHVLKQIELKGIPAEYVLLV